jgi:magnesium chelatase subunit H
MTQKPISAERPALRAVIVTLDNHIAGAVNRAAANLRKDMPGFELNLHAATDWAGNPASLERCKKDIAEGDIIIANMLFIEEHIQAVMPALLARRESCDAMAGFMSAGEVIKLTRLGRFKMDGSQGGIVSMLKRLRGAKKHDSTAGAQQLAMLKRLPQILRFIPGTAQDVRAYFMAMQYWLAGSEDNIGNLIRSLVGRYADGPRQILRSRVKAEAPKAYPDNGVYHPRLAGRIGEFAEKLPAPQAPRRGTVGIMLMRSYVLAADTGHYDGVIAAFESRGLKVVPAFATGLDSRPAIEKFFMKNGMATVDAVVSLSGFSLVGGPAYNDAKAAEALLAKLDVPYIAAHPVEFQTMQQWGASDRGLLPVESTIMVAIPELEGSTGPAVFGGRSDGSSSPCTGCENACVFPVTKTRDMHVCPERAEMLAARVAKLVSLRRSARADRKVGLVIFNFPPNAGNTGTAAYLSVFESIHNTMIAMQAGGYGVDVPPTVDALRAAVIHGNAAHYGAMANVAALP